MENTENMGTETQTMQTTLADLEAAILSGSTDSIVDILEKTDNGEVLTAIADKVNKKKAKDKTEKRDVFMKNFTSYVGTKQALEKLLADDFPGLSKDEEIHVDISVVVTANGASSVMKVKPSTLKSPIYVGDDNTESSKPVFESFGKRGYNKKKS